MLYKALLLCACACAGAAADSSRAAEPFRAPAEVATAPSGLALRQPLNALVAAGGRLVAAGQRGHILYSDDGRAWTQAAVPSGADLTALSFPTPLKGWAVGHEGVLLHSVDGGAHWQRQFERPDPERAFLDVWFEDERRGWAVGAFNLIVHTEDGGQRWTPWSGQVDNPRGLHLYAIRPAGGTLFAVGEQGLVLRLDRAARRFVGLTLPYQGTLFGLVGNERMLLVHGLRGHALRSTDGGVTWTPVETGASASLTSSVWRADGSIVLASQSGQLLLSSDEGASFRPIQTSIAAPAFAVAEAAHGAVAVAGMGGIRIEAVK